MYVLYSVQEYSGKLGYVSGADTGSASGPTTGVYRFTAYSTIAIARILIFAILSTSKQIEKVLAFMVDMVVGG